MATTVRQPFGELSSSRVQQLASAKNRQNGFIAKSSPLRGKPMTPSTSMTPGKVTGKRAYTPSIYEENGGDAENVDPALCSPSKKSKVDSCEAMPKFSLAPASSAPSSLSSGTPSTSMPPPAAKFSTPRQMTSASSPRAPLTAPAGRSPGRKIAGISKSRRRSAPFSRVDPPFASRGSSLPFSLDAALNNTLPTTTPASPKVLLHSMPASWSFEIYEDAPGEEAANLMEHSTLVMDLSSDDEAVKAKRDDRGKENTPPEGYDAGFASRPSNVSTEHSAPAPKWVKKTELVRRKTEEMDDGERSPLSNLDAEPFIPEGFDKDSHTIVDASPGKTIHESKDVFATLPPRFTITDTSKLSKDNSNPHKASSFKAKDTQVDIPIFEDSPETAIEHTHSADKESITARSAKEAVDDENSAPEAQSVA